MRTADNLSTFMCRLSLNLGASASWNPSGLSRPVMGLLYHNFYRLTMEYVCLLRSSLLKIIAPMHLTNSQNHKKKKQQEESPAQLVLFHSDSFIMSPSTITPSYTTSASSRHTATAAMLRTSKK